MADTGDLSHEPIQKLELHYPRLDLGAEPEPPVLYFVKYPSPTARREFWKQTQAIKLAKNNNKESFSF